MDFAKKQLEKYGWKEGKGLGKNEAGITTALKPTLKFDTAGVGHDASEQFRNNWWENVYNSASNNLTVVSSKGNVQVCVKDPDGVEITTKNYSVKNFKKHSNSEYGSFIKTSKLTKNGLIDLKKEADAKEVPKMKSTELTDDELFAVCGGRTAHKGARHGLNLNGKLSRLDKQEKLLLKKLKHISLSNDTEMNKSIEKKIKKIYQHKQTHAPELMDEDSGLVPSLKQGAISPQKSKKRNRERKRVSFSETVTEYQPQHVDPNATQPSNDVDSGSGSLSDASSRPSTPVIVRTVKIPELDRDQHREIIDSLGLEEDEVDCDECPRDMRQLKDKIKDENRRMRHHLKKLYKKYPSDSELFKNWKDDASALEATPKPVKRKLELLDQIGCCELKKSHNDVELSKYEKKKLKKKRRKLQKRLNKVTDSLTQFKITDNEGQK